MKNLKIYILLILITLLLAFQASANFVIVKGVKVYFEATSDMFPVGWRNENIRAKAETPSLINKEAYIKIIENELNKYTETIIKNNIDKIYIVNNLEFYGSKVAGSYFTGKGENIIYLSIIQGQDIIDALHHEFFSIVYYNNKNLFPKVEWESLNKLPYWNNTWEAVKDDNIKTGYQTKYAEAGFICSYARTSFSNDMSSMAEMCFSPGSYSHIYYKKYDVIHKKYDLIKKFYKAIDNSIKFPDMMAVAEF
jgi:hypothetical protein